MARASKTESKMTVSISCTLLVCLLVTSAALSYLLGTVARSYLQNPNEAPTCKGDFNIMAVDMHLRDSYSRHKTRIAPQLMGFGDSKEDFVTQQVVDYQDEALVHPSMIAHRNPTNVAILGDISSSAGALREVLKHGTVQTVSLVEDIDLSLDSQRKLSDCSNIQGVTDNCYEDPRVNIYEGDLSQWLVNSYNIDDPSVVPIDVVIITKLQNDVNSSIVLFESVFHVLAHDGVVSARMGEALSLRESKQKSLVEKNVALQVLTGLESVGYEEVHIFEESRSKGDFKSKDMFSESIWTYANMVKDNNAYHARFAGEALLNLRIRERSAVTRSGGMAIQTFDGATMLAYQYPSRPIEESFCRSDMAEAYGVCEDGHGFNPEAGVIQITSLEVRNSTVENAGRGLFTNEAIKKGSMMALTECTQSIHVPHYSQTILEKVVSHSIGNAWDTMLYYFKGYGFVFDYFGNAIDVDPGIVTFVNHGCNGTFNVGSISSTNELQTNITLLSPSERMRQLHQAYNPYLDRNVRADECRSDKALRDINAGEEIFNNYLSFVPMESWEDYAEDLRRACSGQLGLVQEYESLKESGTHIDFSSGSVLF